MILYINILAALAAHSVGKWHGVNALSKNYL